MQTTTIRLTKAGFVVKINFFHRVVISSRFKVHLRGINLIKNDRAKQYNRNFDQCICISSSLKHITVKADGRVPLPCNEQQAHVRRGPDLYIDIAKTISSI